MGWIKMDITVKTYFGNLPNVIDLIKRKKRTY